MKLQPCTLWRRHRWSFIKNVAYGVTLSSGAMRFSKRGVYRCECGAQKTGPAGHED